MVLLDYGGMCYNVYVYIIVRLCLYEVVCMNINILEILYILYMCILYVYYIVFS